MSTTKRIYEAIMEYLESQFPNATAEELENLAARIFEAWTNGRL